MKRIFPIHLFCLSGVALVLGACTSEVTDGGNTPADGPVPISFQTPETRAAKDGFGAGDAFSVWGWYADDAAGTNPRQVFKAEEVTNGGNNSWSYDGTQYWIAGKTYDFYAVYPTTVTATVSSDGTIKVDDFDASKTGTEAVDLMTAERKGMDGSVPETVAFTFGHELSRLSFTVTSEGDAVTIVSAALVGANYKGTLSGETWSVLTASTADGPFKAENVSLTAENLSATLFGGDLLLIPSNSLANAQLTLTYYYDDATETTTKTLSLGTTTVTAWEKGKSYQYKVAIPQDNVDASFVVTVKNWIPQDATVEW